MRFIGAFHTALASVYPFYVLSYKTLSSQPILPNPTLADYKRSVQYNGVICFLSYINESSGGHVKMHIAQAICHNYAFC